VWREVSRVGQSARAPDRVPLKHTFSIVFSSGDHEKKFLTCEKQGFGGSHLGHIFSIMDDIIEDILIIEQM